MATLRTLRCPLPPLIPPHPPAGQGHRRDGDILHRRARRRHAHAHVVRCQRWGGPQACVAAEPGLPGPAPAPPRAPGRPAACPRMLLSSPAHTHPPTHPTRRCGTDYENEKSRSCSSYFNMLYEVGRSGGRGALGGAPGAQAAWRPALRALAPNARFRPSAAPRCPAQYVKVGIADPSIHWIDLGASRRSAKTAIGFTGHPVR